MYEKMIKQKFVKKTIKKIYQINFNREKYIKTTKEMPMIKLFFLGLKMLRNVLIQFFFFQVY